jgi:putative endonuclease
LNPLAPLYKLADNLRYRKLRNTSRQTGQHGEDIAHRHLRRLGFTVVARNWRPPQGGGEIDIIAWEGDWLVFVEVKTRASAEVSVPERAINPDKIDALRRAARDYIRRSSADEGHVRFDAVSVTGATVEHFREAFPPLPPVSD